MPSFLEALEAFDRIKKEIAVWDSIVDHLYSNMDEESSGMCDDDGRVIEAEVLEAVASKIKDDITAPLRQMVDTYENLAVEKDNGKRAKQKGASSDGKGKGKGKTNPASGGGTKAAPRRNAAGNAAGNAPRRVRRVARRPRGAGTS